VYGRVMNYLIAVLAFFFLVVTLNIDIFKHFIRNEAYWEGLHVIPILLTANIFLGVYMNQSIWYKLSGQTKFGAYISIFGATGTVVLLLVLIPLYGYTAAAWTTMVIYGGQMVASYLLGQKYYPIKYNLRKAGFYFFFAIALYFMARLINLDSGTVQFVVHNFFVLLFVGVVYWVEKR